MLHWEFLHFIFQVGNKMTVTNSRSIFKYQPNILFWSGRFSFPASLQHQPFLYSFMDTREFIIRFSAEPTFGVAVHSHITCVLTIQLNVLQFIIINKYLLMYNMDSYISLGCTLTLIFVEMTQKTYQTIYFYYHRIWMIMLCTWYSNILLWNNY